MSYKCGDCKDKGFIVLLTSTVPCDCKAQEPTAASDPSKRGRPYWFAGYESYAAYVADVSQST